MKLFVNLEQDDDIENYLQSFLAVVTTLKDLEVTAGHAYVQRMDLLSLE